MSGIGAIFSTQTNALESKYIHKNQPDNIGCSGFTTELWNDNNNWKQSNSKQMWNDPIIDPYMYM